jgi:hypothetical protein
LINEIVLEEESDDDGSGGYISHFELYRRAMLQCGANTSAIDRLVGTLAQRSDLARALAGAPPAAQRFVQTTMDLLASDSIHATAAAFTLGREDVIPLMFQALVARLRRRFPGELGTFQDYLDRHIHLDGERHAPMALEMLAVLCGDNPINWHAAENAVRVSIAARIALWDGVRERIHAANRPNAGSDGVRDRCLPYLAPAQAAPSEV